MKYELVRVRCTMTAEGRFYSDVGRFVVPMHFIEDKLLDALSENVNRFKSDFLTGWENVVEFINSTSLAEIYGNRWIFGFREDGVDGAFEVSTKIADYTTYGDPLKKYGEIYELVATVNDGEIEFKLYECAVRLEKSPEERILETYVDMPENAELKAEIDEYAELREMDFYERYELKIRMAKEHFLTQIK